MSCYANPNPFASIFAKQAYYKVVSPFRVTTVRVLHSIHAHSSCTFLKHTFHAHTTHPFSYILSIHSYQVTYTTAVGVSTGIGQYKYTTKSDCLTGNGAKLSSGSLSPSNAVCALMPLSFSPTFPYYITQTAPGCTATGTAVVPMSTLAVTQTVQGIPQYILSHTFLHPITHLLTQASPF